MDKKYSPDELSQMIDAMSLEEKVGQLFLLAYPGKDPQRIAAVLDQYGICGCYISQDNAENFAEAQRVSASLQSMAETTRSGIPLMLGVDQEGAWGVLIPDSHPGPGNLALGALGDPERIQEMYRIFGQEMLSVGYNTLLAPCADVNFHPESPIIGTRSFGEDPKQVASYVAAAIQGAKKTGIVTTIKHFPGHGATEQDTHRELPRVDKTMDRLLKEDLLPYVAGIAAGVDIVMTTHIVYPRIDAQHPATLSKIILHDILRKTMDFKGVILSDSMNMGAIRKKYDPAESTVMALKAGVDIVMLSEEHYDHDEHYLEKQLQSLEHVKKAVQDGRISETEVDAKLLRILDLKLNIMQIRGAALTEEQRAEFDSYEIDLARACLQFSHKKMPRFSSKQSIVCLNTSPRKNYQRLMNPRGIGPNQEKPAFDSFRERLADLGDRVQFISFEELKEPQTEQSLSNADVLLVVREDYPLPGEDFAGQEQSVLIQDLFDKHAGKMVVVELCGVYAHRKYPKGVPWICSNSSRTCAAIAAAESVRD